MAERKSFKSMMQQREETINDNANNGDLQQSAATKQNEEIKELLNINSGSKEEAPKPEQKAPKENKGTGKRAKHTNRTLTEKRNIIINTRITEEQYNKLLADAQAKEFRSVSDYLYSIIKKNI